MSALKSLRQVLSSKKKYQAHHDANSSAAVVNSASKSPKQKNGKKYNKNIEQKMQKASDADKKTLRILLVGPGDSGKTTLVKQMRKIHNTLRDDDLELMTSYIQESIIEYAKILCIQSKTLSNNPDNDEKTDVSDQNISLRDEIINLSKPFIFNFDLASKINSIWNDPGIQRTYSLRAKYYQIHDNVSHFLHRIHIIYNANYIPTFSDYLRIRTITTGLSTDTINIKLPDLGQYTFKFIDVGGQRSERKKWMKILFDNIDAVLYVIALSEYDMNCFEDNTTNRIHEAISLFKEIINVNVPITVAFDDFPIDKLNPNDPVEVVKFVAKKFLSCFDGSGIVLNAPIHIHRTTALDTDNIQKLFQDITVDLVKINLKNIGML